MGGGPVLLSSLAEKPAASMAASTASSEDCLGSSRTSAFSPSRNTPALRTPRTALQGRPVAQALGLAGQRAADASWRWLTIGSQHEHGRGRAGDSGVLT